MLSASRPKHDGYECRNLVIYRDSSAQVMCLHSIFRYAAQQPPLAHHGDTIERKRMPIIPSLTRSLVRPRNGFGPATQGEQIVFGARRPGFPLPRVSREIVDAWLEYMHCHAMQRVVCLLPPSQLASYTCDLLAYYRSSFGDQHVCWAPIDDFCLADSYLLTNRILPFLLRADRDQARVVVHCSGGIGRTGHVLAAWLVVKYALSNAQAIATVRRSGRNARESRDSRLDALLDTCRQVFVRSEGEGEYLSYRSARIASN
jgi:hypothetical protein